MAQFVLEISHPPDQCPTANAKVRKLQLPAAADLPSLGKKLGVKFLAGPLVTTEHRSIAIVEAREEEAIRPFALQSGMIRYNSIRVSLGVPMEQALREVNELDPIY